jgi:predicted DCC family thiol-disulfide oxidoreductase YuxK
MTMMCDYRIRWPNIGLTVRSALRTMVTSRVFPQVAAHRSAWQGAMQ